MSALRQRTISLIFLSLFFVASLAQHAPAVCCVVDEAAVEETDSCCPPEEREECPEEEPCERDTCPKTCCSLSSDELQAPVSTLARQVASLDLASVRPPVAERQQPVVLHAGNPDPPFDPPKTARHLYLQVLLR